MSWLDEDEVENLRKVYNKEHSKESAIASGPAEIVWKELQARLRAKCKTGRAECIVASMVKLS